MRKPLATGWPGSVALQPTDESRLFECCLHMLFRVLVPVVW